MRTLIIHFIFLLSFVSLSKAQIYVFDVKDPSTYSYNCGTTTGSYWGVKNDSCTLLTTPTFINESCGIGDSIILPIGLKINQTGQLSCVDTAWVSYTVDGGITWTYIDTIIGCEQVSNTQYNYYPQIPNNSYFQLNITLDNGAPNDWWQIMNGDIVINEPCFLLSLDVDNENCGTDDQRPEILNTAWKTTIDEINLPIRIYCYGDILDKKDVLRAFEEVENHLYGTNINIQIDNNIYKIEDERFYNFSKDMEKELLEMSYDSSVINIYVFPSVETTKSVLGYTYINGPNAIFMSYSGFINKSSLSHEIGHKLGLLHTHAYGNELVNGDNCDNAGDGICDTPADPGLTGLVNQCEYKGYVIDANGDAYVPDITNIMSYSPSNCRINFTYGQIDVMKTVLFNMELTPIRNTMVLEENNEVFVTEYYDLYGRRINGPVRNNLYIEVNGEMVSKNVIF